MVVAALTQGDLLEKCVSNVKEVKSRGAVVMVITQERYQDLVKDIADKLVIIPDTVDFEATITSIIPMQIFAYYMSVQKGCDVDKPRNLAKALRWNKRNQSASDDQNAAICGVFSSFVYIHDKIV